MNYKLLILIAAVIVVGCSKDASEAILPSNEYEVSTTPIGFTTNESSSKGNITESFVSGDSFGVYSYYIPDGDEITNASAYFSNLSVGYNGTVWSYSPTQYWPTLGTLSFFAYYPYIERASVSQNNNGEPILTYTVASNAIDQKDLLIAKVEDATFTDASSVDFSFKHALSMITVSFTNTCDNEAYAMRVTNVSLGNIMTTASINMATQTVTASVEGNVSALLSNGSLSDTYIDGNTTETITTNNGYFFIPPQTFITTAILSAEVELYKIEETEEVRTYTLVSEYVATALLTTTLLELTMGKSYAMSIEYGDSIGGDSETLKVTIVEVWESIDNDNDI